MNDPSYFSLVVSAILVNNVVLSRFLGICPLLGVSKQVGTAKGMFGAVLFVMTLASFVTSLLYKLILVPMDLAYLRTIVFIVVIASLVQLVEVLLQRFAPGLNKALGIYLPLITTNCAVLGVAVEAALKDYSVVRATVYGTASAVAFGVALILFANIRERLELARIPQCLQGTAIALITAGVLAMAFMGFSGLAG